LRLDEPKCRIDIVRHVLLPCVDVAHLRTPAKLFTVTRGLPPETQDEDLIGSRADGVHRIAQLRIDSRMRLFRTGVDFEYERVLLSITAKSPMLLAGKHQTAGARARVELRIFDRS